MLILFLLNWACDTFFNCCSYRNSNYAIIYLAVDQHFILHSHFALRSSGYPSISLRLQAATVWIGSKALHLALSGGLSDDTEIAKNKRYSLTLYLIDYVAYGFYLWYKSWILKEICPQTSFLTSWLSDQSEQFVLSGGGRLVFVFFVAWEARWFPTTMTNKIHPPGPL